MGPLAFPGCSWLLLACVGGWVGGWVRACVGAWVPPRGSPRGSLNPRGNPRGNLWEALGNPRGSPRVSPRVTLGVHPRGSPSGSHRVSQRVSPHARSSQERTGRSGGYLSKLSGCDESGWCSDVPSAAQAWKDAGVRIPLGGGPKAPTLLEEGGRKYATTRRRGKEEVTDQGQQAGVCVGCEEALEPDHNRRPAAFFLSCALFFFAVHTDKSAQTF